MAAPTKARVVVEVVVDSVAGAVAAENAGAHRLELCCGLLEGGLTPSLGLLAMVRSRAGIPVFAMVRPRGGDFLYDESEFEVIERDVALLREAGADGIVTGVLTAEGRLDERRMARVKQLAGSLPVTCHRAFDLCADPMAALATLGRIGVQRVLTSGQCPTAAVGSETIARLVAAAPEGLTVMAGVGVNASNAAELVGRTGCREIHLSATAWRQSAMQFRRDGVPMGTQAPPGEFVQRTTDGAAVAAVLAAVQ